MADLLIEAMDARDKGDAVQARQILAQALVQDPHNEGAWMMMSEVVDDIQLRRNCLQRVLMINPKNEAANIALMKLDTSPLGPVVRGERYKPVVPPKADKTPPFTPPFTWTGDDAQFQALGDMVYPDLTGEQVNRPPEKPASFDWAAESSEPDQTIEKIFAKVSNPESAAQPVPDTDLDWLEAQSKQAMAEQGLTDEEKEARMLDQLVGDTVAAAIEPAAGPNGSKPPTAPPATEPAPLLWDNPDAKTNRLVILGVNSIIYAHPAESDLPHILGLFNEKKMLRDLLGDSARTIKFENIQQVTADPKKPELTIKYTLGDKPTEQLLSFASPNVCDEMLSALEQRLGDGFTRRTKKTTARDRYLPPLLAILVIAALTWFFIAGAALLGQLPAFQSGLLYLILFNVEYYVNQIGAFNILMIGIILVLLCLVWMVVNRSKPAELVIVERG